MYHDEEFTRTVFEKKLKVERESKIPFQVRCSTFFKSCGPSNKTRSENTPKNGRFACFRLMIQISISIVLGVRQNLENS